MISLIKHIVLIHLLLLLVVGQSCRKPTDDNDPNSAIDIDPDFVPNTTVFDVLNETVPNCFYENNLVKAVVDSAVVIGVEWSFFEEDGDEIVLNANQTHQYFSTEGKYECRYEGLVDGDIIDTTIHFNLSFCPASIYFSDGFQPDGDGQFDTWGPVGTGIKSINYVIKSEYGEVLFESSDLNKTWDGTYDGQPVPPGTYFYKVKGSYFTGYIFEYTGSLELIL